MRVMLASLLVFVVTPAFAQKVLALPPEFLSPTLMQGWQAEPSIPNVENQAQLALQWAWPNNPTYLFAVDGARGDLLTRSRWFQNGRSAARPQPSTVGEGVSQ